MQPWPYRLPGGRRDEWRLPLQLALLIELHSADLVSWMQETYSGASLSGEVTINQPQDEGSRPGYGVEVASNEAQATGSGAVFNGQAASNKAQDKATRGAKTRGILEAIEQLWGAQIPKGLTAKERNNAIRTKMKENGSSIPKGFDRAVQRALKLRRPT